MLCMFKIIHEFMAQFMAPFMSEFRRHTSCDVPRTLADSIAGLFGSDIEVPRTRTETSEDVRDIFNVRTYHKIVPPLYQHCASCWDSGVVLCHALKLCSIVLCLSQHVSHNMSPCWEDFRVTLERQAKLLSTQKRSKASGGNVVNTS